METEAHRPPLSRGRPPSALDAAARTAAQQRGLLTLAQARRCGIGASELRRLVRRGEWRQVLPEVYAVVALQKPEDEGGRVRTAALAAQLTLGPAAFAGGETAARLWGMQGLGRWDGRRVHMVLQGAVRHIPGIVLHDWHTAPEDITAVGGIRLTRPGRTLRDTLLGVDRATGVCLLDSALNQRLVRDEALPSLEAANSGRRGCRKVRGWRSLADGRAQSPLETRIRLICRDGGLPPTELQRRFYDESGRLIGIADFWWAESLLIGEADGLGPHSMADALARDRRRQNALLTQHPGTRVVRFTWHDLDRPGYILSTVVDAGRSDVR